MKYKVLLTFAFSAILLSCSTVKNKEELSVKELFWNYERINIQKINSFVSKKAITNNQKANVNIQTSKSRGKKNINETQQLSEVIVTAQNKMSFVPINKGQVNLRFRVSIPKVFFNEDWRLKVTPYAVLSDTVIELLPLYLKGQGFYNKQKQDYAKYDEYLNTIVPLEKYDSAFFERRSAEFAIYEKRKEYYTNYKNKFKKQQEFKKWYSDQKKRFHDNKIQKRAKLEKDKSIYNIYAKNNVEKEFNKGNDTTGLYNAYMEYINMEIAEFESKNDTLIIPEQNKELIFSDYPKNRVFTLYDSINLSKDYYLKDKILLNEDKIKQKDAVKEYLIPFFYEEEYKIDTLLSNYKNNFVYIYETSIPVESSAKNVKVYLQSHIDATDLSTFTPQVSDTLTYVISSLSQLADRSLKYKERTIHKEGNNRMKINFRYEKDSYSINENNNRNQIKEILTAYNLFREKGGYVIDTLEIVTSLSLDGKYEENAEIATKRAENIKEILLSKIDNSETDIKLNVIGEDWNGLVREMKKNSSLSNREAIFDLLSAAVKPNQTKAEIQNKYPKDWRIIKNQIFPLLNKTEIVLKMRQPNMTEETSTHKEENKGYEQALQLMEDKKYWDALQILKDYGDYNAALCLVALNYNEKAKEVLERLDKTADNQYLLAIVNIRLGKKYRAIQNLKSAVEMDETKLSRIKIDDEVYQFCKKNHLFNLI
jgi:hypothetical protein